MLSFQPLIIWGFTVVTSYIFEFLNEARVYKDAADNGYSINVRKLKEFSNQSSQKGSNLFLLIPIYNIFAVFKRTMDYSNNRESILNQLYSMGALDEFKDTVKEKYNKRPTLLNSVVCTIRNQVLIDIKQINTNITNAEIEAAKELNANAASIPSLGTIYYRINGEEIEIVKATRMFKDKEKDFLIFTVKNLLEFKKEREKEKTNNSTEQSDKLNMISDTKEKYQSLRDEVVNEIELNNQQETKEDNPTLKMRK